MGRTMMYVATVCFVVLLSHTHWTQAQAEETSCACWDDFDISNVSQASVNGRVVHNDATWLRRGMSLTFKVYYDWATCCQNGVYVAITVDDDDIGTYHATCRSGCCRWYDKYADLDDVYLKPGKLTVRVKFDRNFCPGQRVFYPIRGVVIPGFNKEYMAMIIGLSVAAILLVGGISACVILCKARRHHKAKQTETEQSAPPPYST